MRVLHITEKVEGASGVATFVRELDASLRAQGVESRVCNHVEQVDILHIHGLWLSIYHQAASWARAKGIPVVWSTHGMTAPWSMHHKRWKKLAAWILYQKCDLRDAAAIHCTTDLEVGWNKALGFKNCFIAPLGTTLPSKELLCASRLSLCSAWSLPQGSRPPSRGGYESLCGIKPERTLLFVGRIYPVKGLVNLIKAWKIAVSGERWKLRIVGPDEAGHKAELEKLVVELGLCDSVEFAGPKFGDELSAEYENCDCLVLPSFTENFGATVVDAMSHSKPVITSTFTPWKIVQDRGCGWWVSNEPAKLAAAIDEMMSLDDATRHEMGARGCKLVEEKYTWDAVARIMINEYQKVISSCQ